MMSLLYHCLYCSIVFLGIPGDIIEVLMLVVVILSQPCGYPVVTCRIPVGIAVYKPVDTACSTLVLSCVQSTHFGTLDSSEGA